MTLVLAFIILVGSTLWGVIRAADKWRRVACIFALVLGVASLYTAVARVLDTPIPVAAPEIGKANIDRTDGDVQPSAYSVHLVSGEITPNGERWSFLAIGSVPATRDSGEIVGPTTSAVFERNISKSFFLSRLGIRIYLGWDERGGEFLTVEPVSWSTYIRPFNSYWGIFPRRGDDFAATRLFITGRDVPADGTVLGRRIGSMAFLLVTPVSGDEIILGIDEVFTSLKCTVNPYSGSNNIGSFDEARRLLLRGACFPRSREGILPIIADTGPLFIALLLIGCAAVMVGLNRSLALGLLFGAFYFLISLVGLSSLETDRVLAALRSSQEPNVSAIASTVASPLWRDRSLSFLNDLASDSSSQSRATWANFAISLSPGRISGAAPSNDGEGIEELEPGESPQ
ncbi:MAG: hypothetical protein WC712_02395 [Candidatus Brocadiia bacterium]